MPSSDSGSPRPEARPPVVGSCYGFGVQSWLPLTYLRAGTGELLEVSSVSTAEAGDPGPVLHEWAPPRFPAHARLHAAGQGVYRLWVADAGWFHIDAAQRRIEAPESTNLVRLEERVWSLPALLCFLHRGDLPLHAAAVEIDGRAVLLAAPGRGGKTTLATALARAGHRLLSEDLACVRTSGAGQVVIPGPAMLRIRRDVPAEWYPPQFTEVGRDHDRVHLAGDRESRRDCTPVPLAGVVLLGPHSEAHPLLDRVSPAAAVPDLWRLSLNLPNDEGRARCFSSVAALAAAVPVWNLRRRMRFTDLSATVAQVIDSVDG